MGTIVIGKEAQHALCMLDMGEQKPACQNALSKERRQVPDKWDTARGLQRPHLPLLAVLSMNEYCLPVFLLAWDTSWILDRSTTPLGFVLSVTVPFMNLRAEVADAVAG